ncbi:hypothetical protein [Entomobacter blattae]|uniref:Uncharacterized protein n=1 Tax=Entomobacter blattae TaxID=2762277 RepID=A0A7H1NP78_9PROT|nr:hypothetical protein [Entomobacter blattae]QNT77588.1 hypothetical protein JGUZn3_03310 [Entomobacter blattae]
MQNSTLMQKEDLDYQSGCIAYKIPLLVDVIQEYVEKLHPLEDQTPEAYYHTEVINTIKLMLYLVKIDLEDFKSTLHKSGLTQDFSLF